MAQSPVGEIGLETHASDDKLHTAAPGFPFPVSGKPPLHAKSARAMLAHTWPNVFYFRHLQFATAYLGLQTSTNSIPLPLDKLTDSDKCRCLVHFLRDCAGKKERYLYLFGRAISALPAGLSEMFQSAPQMEGNTFRLDGSAADHHAAIAPD